MTDLQQSCVDSANSVATDFPLNNLPYGVFSTGNAPPRCGVAIGDMILDLAALEEMELITLPGGPAFTEPAWNTVMRRGPSVWQALRNDLISLLSYDSDQAEALAPYLFPMEAAIMHLPIEISGFTDFFANYDHAKNVGTIFRGPEAAVADNWPQVPVGYNARAGTIYVSGTDIHRPLGQVKLPYADLPSLMPEPKLDYELEFGAIVGTPNPAFKPSTLEQAEQMIFGYILVNDWSARAIQAWEARPLGPFLSKSFATTISPWIVTPAALAPFRCPAPERTQPILPYLQEEGPMHYDVDLEARLKTGDSGAEMTIATTNYRRMYFSLPQQLCHHMINGTAMTPGDVLGSGTVSGPEPENRGCLLERTWNGSEPLVFPDGTSRTFLEDGDELILAGHAQGDGFRIGFGECRGRVLPAAKVP